MSYFWVILFFNRRCLPDFIVIITKQCVILNDIGCPLYVFLLYCSQRLWSYLAVQSFDCDEGHSWSASCAINDISTCLFVSIWTFNIIDVYIVLILQTANRNIIKMAISQKHVCKTCLFFITYVISVFVIERNITCSFI